MENLYLYKINEQYSKYMYEKNKKVMKAFEEKRKRPFVRNKLYNLIVFNKANINLKNRCCDFKNLEEMYNKFKSI